MSNADIIVASDDFRSVYISRAPRSEKDWKGLGEALRGKMTARCLFCCKVHDPFKETSHVKYVTNAPKTVFEIRVTDHPAYRAFAFAEGNNWRIATIIPKPKPKDYVHEALVADEARKKHVEIVANAKSSAGS